MTFWLCVIALGAEKMNYDENSIAKVTGGIHRKEIKRRLSCIWKSFLEMARTHEKVQEINAMEF